MLVPDAITPVTNGNTAAPADEKLAIQPTAPTMSSGGRTPPAWFMTIGKMGPRRKPTHATVTPPPTSDGTSHTTSSSPSVRSMYRKMTRDWPSCGGCGQPFIRDMKIRIKGGERRGGPSC